MISLLIVAHANLGECLIQCAAHVLGQRPEQLENLDLSSIQDPDAMLAHTLERLSRLDRGDGVLILTDIYGATPCNIVCKVIQGHRVEAIAGINLPMLLKALNYRDRDMGTLIAKAVSGGQSGIFHIASEPKRA